MTSRNFGVKLSPSPLCHTSLQISDPPTEMTSNFPRRFTLSPRTANCRKTCTTEKLLGTGSPQKSKKHRTFKKLSHVSRVVGQKVLGATTPAWKCSLGSPSSIVRTELHGSRLCDFVPRGRSPRACLKIFENSAPATPKFGGRPQFEKNAIWAMRTPTVPEVFAKKSLPIFEISNFENFHKITLFSS